MNSHLVSIEVCVERGTYKRMKFDSFTLYKNGLKCLNTQSVKCRSTVQHNGMLMYNILKHIPYLVVKSVNKLLGVLDIL